VVSSPPASEATGAMGREIESRQGIHRVVALKKSGVNPAIACYNPSPIFQRPVLLHFCKHFYSILFNSFTLEPYQVLKNYFLEINLGSML
jgi:hypothetical protein